MTTSLTAALQCLITIIIALFPLLRRLFEEMLGLKKHQSCVLEAAQLDYFVAGFWWAKEMNFTCQQISFIMALLQLLLDNIASKYVESVKSISL